LEEVVANDIAIPFGYYLSGDLKELLPLARLKFDVGAG